MSYKKLNLDYRISEVGTNISVSYEQNLKKISFFTGLMYHINRDITDNQGAYYRHRFYHRAAAEGFGFTAGLSYPINIPKSNLGLHWLFVSQINYMDHRILWPRYDSTYNYVYYEYFYPENNKIVIVENCIGLGANIKAYKNLYLNASSAIGIANFIGVDPYYNGDKLKRTEWEFSHHLKIGLSYRLNPRRKAS
jgi:hypothetical protein